MRIERVVRPIVWSFIIFTCLAFWYTVAKVAVKCYVWHGGI